MRILLLIVIPYLSIFLESTLFSRYSLRGTVPDLVLIIVTFYALLNGRKAGFSYGFVCGLFEDLYLGRFIGMNALAKGLTGYVVGKLEVNVFKDNILVGFGGVIFSTVLNSTLMLLLAQIGHPHLVIDRSFLINLSGQVVYNGLLSIPFYVWYYRISKSDSIKMSKF